MRFANFLKTILLLCSSFLWLSCSSWEDVVAPDEFQPLKIISVSPDSAKVGDNIIITGENFLKEKDLNLVWFTPQISAAIDSATNTQLFLKVPDGALSGSAIVANAVYSDTSDNSFTVLKTAIDPASPVITDFSPKSGISGTVVTLTGQKFGFKKEDARIFFGNIQAEIITITDTLLKVRAPFNSKDVQITINVNGKTGAAGGVFKTVRRKHKIELFIPNGGYIGDDIRILTILDKKGDTSGIRFTLGKIPMNIKKIVSTRENYFDVNLADIEFLVEIPEMAVNAPISLNFFGDGVKSEDIVQILERKAPVITSVSPAAGYPASTLVTIKGENFGSKVRVKMGGDVEIIATVTNNQFYFTVPEGAKTGKICIQTLEGKVICSDSEFTILKGINEAIISFNGIRAYHTWFRAEGTGGGGTSSGSSDTSIVNKGEYSLKSCPDPYPDYIKNTFSSQNACYPGQGIEIPVASFSDSIFHCLTRGSYDNRFIYDGIEITIDTTKQIVNSLRIYHSEFLTIGGGYNSMITFLCVKRFIKLSNVPYEVINGKKHIKLNAAQMQNSNFSYNSYSGTDSHSTGGSRYAREGSEYRIVGLLPDAYFELTLE